MSALVHTDSCREVPGDPGRLSIHLEAEDRLRRSGYRALRDISCDARDGVAYLRGHLPSYHLKQVAQATVGGIEGVRRDVNRIEVVAPAGRAPAGRDRATVTKSWDDPAGIE
jgi:hypothetical protein